MLSTLNKIVIKSRKLSAVMGTFSITVLGLSQIEPQIERAISTKIPDRVFNIVVLSSITILFLSIFLLVMSFIASSTRDAKYYSKIPREDELSFLRKFAVKFFGESFANEKKILEWIKTNTKSVIAIFKVRSFGSLQFHSIKGFFVVVPLTQHAVNLYKEAQIDGASFLKEHITSKRGDVFGVYIGAIAAADDRAKSISLLMLHKLLEKYHKLGIKVVLARPTTDRGQELVALYGMKPILSNVIDGRALYERNF